MNELLGLAYYVPCSSYTQLQADWRSISQVMRHKQVYVLFHCRWPLVTTHLLFVALGSCITTYAVLLVNSSSTTILCNGML